SSAHAIADTYPRQAGVDAQHYVFRLTLLTSDSNEIQGEATVRLRVTANGVRLINNIHGERTAFSENWFHNARQWLPTIDHIADKATVEFVITTKAEYQVISNGLLVDQEDLPGSLRRTHWSQGEAVSPWLYS